MSALYMRFRGPAICRGALRAIGAQRHFQTSRILAVGQESALHDEGRAEKVEAEKQKQLKGQKEGRAEWSDSLSSDSESIVKADRGEMSNTKDTIKELQEESKKKAEQERKQ